MQAHIANRRLKVEVAESLAASDWQDRLETLAKTHPPRRLVSPLFSMLLSQEPVIKWHAVTAFGVVVARLAERELEASRVVIRRFMWTLTDESGGIGWGSPEAMAEIMACHARLAEEYHAIFLSYLLERDGPDNFLEYGPLREGAYWGAARLAQARPELLEPSIPLLGQALGTEVRVQSLGYLCQTFAFLPIEPQGLRDRLQELCTRHEPLSVYLSRRFRRTTLSDLALEALQARA